MTALEREMAADAVALSKEHADRAAEMERRYDRLTLAMRDLEARLNGRWTALRDHITRERAAQDEQAADHGELGHRDQEERAYGRVEALDGLLAAMERMEADR